MTSVVMTGPADEKPGDVHDALAWALSPGGLIWTLAPWPQPELAVGDHPVARPDLSARR